MLVAMTSPSTSFPERTREISAALAPMRRSQPGAMHAFNQLAQSAMEGGTLSPKFKELVALAIGVAGHCDGCIGFHAKALVALGATRAEVEETLAVAVYMGGGPSLMYSADALVAFEQFQKLAAERA
jgi:AhpD family alkylhydroperoxidase